MHSAETPPLSSWNEGPIKRALLAFVDRVTREGSEDFVAHDARVAAFDNDGTLWGEQPMYVQGYFAFDRVKQLSAHHPEWAHQEPFASILAGNFDAVARGGEHALVELLMATHTGLSSDEFEAVVRSWIGTARHPQTKRLFTAMIYQPMRELLDHLRAHQFKTFIVSGGGVDFLRPWAQEVYGIPPEQVVGSAIETRFELGPRGPVLTRLPKVSFVNDGPGKPESIQSHIGRRPLAAFGNTDGDLQMLQWTTSARPSLGLLVHHTDAEREWAYEEHALVGKLDQALALAPEAGWLVVDMKRDWKTIYPPS